MAVGKKANATLQRRGDRAVVNGAEVLSVVADQDE